MDAILENPHEGIGKPETLKYELTGEWSRRITAEHRITYVVTDSTIFKRPLFILSHLIIDKYPFFAFNSNLLLVPFFYTANNLCIYIEAF